MNKNALMIHRMIPAVAVVMALAVTMIVMTPTLAEPSSGRVTERMEIAQPGQTMMEFPQINYVTITDHVREYRVVDVGDVSWCDVKVFFDTDESPAIEQFTLTTSDANIHNAILAAYLGGRKITVKAHEIPTPPGRAEGFFKAAFYEIDEITVAKGT